MIFKNASVFIDGKFTKTDFKTENGIFTEFGKNLGNDETVDIENMLVIPGLFDIHTHGMCGVDFSNAEPEKINELRRKYAEIGVTSVLATTMTSPKSELEKAVKNIGESAKSNVKGAKIEGINLEGPFFGAEKRGAHCESMLIPPDTSFCDSLNKLSDGMIKIVNCDPCLPNAMDFIAENKDKYTISIGHTNCDFATAETAYKNGAGHITHLFNAMREPQHREPGLLGAVCEYPVFAELICDFVHVHPSIVKLMFKAYPEKIVLISDSIPPSAMPNGEYKFGGQSVRAQNGVIKNKNGTIAGSSTNIFNAVKNLISIGISSEAAVLSATYLPAKSVGLENSVGSIKSGRQASFLVIDKNFNLVNTYTDGEKI